VFLGNTHRVLERLSGAKGSFDGAKIDERRRSAKKFQRTAHSVLPIASRQAIEKKRENGRRRHAKSQMVGFCRKRNVRVANKLKINEEKMIVFEKK